MTVIEQRISFIRKVHVEALEEVYKELEVNTDRLARDSAELNDDILSLSTTYDLEVANNVRNKYDSHQDIEYVTKEQLEELEYELSGNSIRPGLLRDLKLPSLERMPKSEFLSAIQRIRKIKELQGL